MSVGSDGPARERSTTVVSLITRPRKVRSPCMKVPSLNGVGAGFCAEMEIRAEPTIRQTMAKVRIELQSVSAEVRQFGRNPIPVFTVSTVPWRWSWRRTVKAHDVATHRAGHAGKSPLRQLVQPFRV